MSHERYDVVLKALNGPLAAMGEQKLQGPLVRIGTNPGPGGFALTGYRGIDARQAVITAYGEGEATVGPVGTNQVRLAPHPHVKWNAIDPLTAPEYLNEGAAIHLGPVGRGCTVQFIRVEKLGVWTTGRVGSAADNVTSVQVSAPVAAARRAAPQRSVARIAAATLPIWIVGCLGLFVAVIAAVLIIVGWNQIFKPEIEKLGPVVEGDEYYEFVDPEKTEMDEKTLEGLQEGYRRFVAAPSAERAKMAGAADISRITEPDQWDTKFFKYMSASVEKHVQSKSFFRRLEAVHEEYAQVLGQLRDAGLPEAIAAMPYTESRYRPELQSWACAKGFWQFMPEVAYRLEAKNGIEFSVRDCKLTKADGSEFLWSPKELAPPPKVKTAVYVDANGEVPDPNMCLIPQNGGCRRDDRTDLKRSTAAAIIALKEAWEDETLSRSGGAAVLTIISHNGGYDDSRFGHRKSFNVLPAFQDWAKKKPEEEHHLFYGEMIKCADSHPPKGFCGSKLAPETQHYGYTIVAQHVLAACYLGKNHDNKFEQFRSWETLLNGYCNRFSIPTAQQVKKW